MTLCIYGLRLILLFLVIITLQLSMILVRINPAFVFVIILIMSVSPIRRDEVTYFPLYTPASNTGRGKQQMILDTC